MTKFVSIKKKSDIPELKGMSLDFEIVDGKVLGVNITDILTGNTIRVTKEGTYTDSIKLLVPEVPKTEEKFEVTVHTSDGEFHSVADSEVAAQSMVNKMDNYHQVITSEITARAFPVEEDYLF